MCHPGGIPPQLGSFEIAKENKKEVLVLLLVGQLLWVSPLLLTTAGYHEYVFFF